VYGSQHVTHVADGWGQVGWVTGQAGLGGGGRPCRVLVGDPADALQQAAYLGGDVAHAFASVGAGAEEVPFLGDR
jgi:hypothetical protein